MFRNPSAIFKGVLDLCCIVFFFVCILYTLLREFIGHYNEYMKIQGLSDIKYIRDISDTPAECK